MVDIKCECIASYYKSIIRVGAMAHKQSLEEELKALEKEHAAFIKAATNGESGSGYQGGSEEIYVKVLKTRLDTIGELIDELDNIKDCD